jgi:hypothetical protein
MELYFYSPNMPLWRGAELKGKHRDNFTSTFIFTALPKYLNFVTFSKDLLAVSKL